MISTLPNPSQTKLWTSYHYYYYYDRPDDNLMTDYGSMLILRLLHGLSELVTPSKTSDLIDITLRHYYRLVGANHVNNQRVLFTHHRFTSSITVYYFTLIISYIHISSLFISPAYGPCTCEEEDAPPPFTPTRPRPPGLKSVYKILVYCTVCTYCVLYC